MFRALFKSLICPAKKMHTNKMEKIRKYLPSESFYGMLKEGACETGVVRNITPILVVPGECVFSQGGYLYEANETLAVGAAGRPIAAHAAFFEQLGLFRRYDISVAAFCCLAAAAIYDVRIYGAGHYIGLFAVAVYTAGTAPSRTDLVCGRTVADCRVWRAVCPVPPGDCHASNLDS